MVSNVNRFLHKHLDVNFFDCGLVVLFMFDRKDYFGESSQRENVANLPMKTATGIELRSLSSLFIWTQSSFKEGEVEAENLWHF